MSLPEIVVSVAIAAMTAITFILFAADKSKAKRGAWRIPEAVLLGCSFLLGGVGGLLGMYCLRHKTKHMRFVLLVPLFAVIDIVFVVFVFWYF